MSGKADIAENPAGSDCRSRRVVPRRDGDGVRHVTATGDPAAAKPRA
jgi:hypothetical protein